jgi:ATP-dependent DNA helicase RecG
MNILENLAPSGDTRPLCENRGSGLASVLTSCRKDRLSPPVFRVDLARFRLILSNRTLFDAPTLEWLDTINRGMTLSENQRYALAHVKHTGWINNSDYCRLTGTDSRVATRELSELVNSGLLDRFGSSRWSTYQLAAEQKDRQTLLF